MRILQIWTFAPLVLLSSGAWGASGQAQPAEPAPPGTATPSPALPDRNKHVPTRPGQAPPPPASAIPSAVPDTHVIVVTGQRGTGVDSVDRYTYFPRDDPDARTGLAIDLLRKVPSVQTTASGGVTLRGDPRVTVLIDGKRPTNGNQALQSLSGAEVERIEVMTSPPAEFSAEGAAGIINIVTKRRSPLGFTGTAAARLSSQDREVVSAVGNLSNGRYTAKIALNAQRASLPSDTDTAYFQPNAAMQSNRLRGDNRNARVDLTLKALIGKSSALSLILLAFNGRRTGTDDVTYRSNDLSYTGHTASINSFSNRVIEGLYETKLASGRIGLTVDARHESKTAPYRSDTVLDGISAGTVRFGERLGVTGTSNDLKTDLTWNGHQARQAKLGFEVIGDLTETDENFYGGSFAPVIDSGGHFRFTGRQTLYSGYASWQQPVLGWTALAGLRFEQQTLDLRADGVAIRRDIPAFYPSLHLSHPAGRDGKIKLSYSRRVSRPGIEAYNPGVRMQTTNVTEVGNPHLKSSNTDAVEAQYVLSRGAVYYEAGVFYRYTKNEQGVLDEVSPTGQITITPVNRGHSAAAGVDVTIRTKLATNLNGSFDANIARVSEPSIVGNPRSYIRSNAGLTIDFTPPSRGKYGRDRYQLQIIYTGRTLNLQGYTSSTYRLDASWSHPIDKNLILTLSATDITNGQQSRTVVESPGVKYILNRRPYARTLQLGIAYTFNNH